VRINCACSASAPHILRDKCTTYPFRARYALSGASGGKSKLEIRPSPDVRATGHRPMREGDRHLGSRSEMAAAASSRGARRSLRTAVTAVTACSHLTRRWSTLRRAARGAGPHGDPRLCGTRAIQRGLHARPQVRGLLARAPAGSRAARRARMLARAVRAGADLLWSWTSTPSASASARVTPPTTATTASLSAGSSRPPPAMAETTGPGIGPEASSPHVAGENSARSARRTTTGTSDPPAGAARRRARSELWVLVSPRALSAASHLNVYKYFVFRTGSRESAQGAQDPR